MRNLYLIFAFFFLVPASLLAQVRVKGYSTYMKYPDRSEVSRDGKFFYISNSVGVEVFKRSQQTGLLERIHQFKSGREGLNEIHLTPDNQFAVVTDYVGNRIIIFKRNATTGKLAVFKSYTNTINGGVNFSKPTHLSMSPNGSYITFSSGESRDSFLVVAKLKNGNLSLAEKKMGEYSKVFFSPNGEFALTSRSNAGYECGYNVMKMTANGNLIDIGCLEGMVRTNRLKPNTNPYRRERQYESVHLSMHSITFSPDGRDVYMQGSHFPTDTRSHAAIIHFRWMNGQLRRQKNYLDLYKKHGLYSMSNLWLDSSGDYLYVGTTGKENSGVFAFKRNTVTGSLQFQNSLLRKNNLSRLFRAHQASFSPDNKHIYVSSFHGGYVIVLHNPNGKPGVKTNIDMPKDDIVDDTIIDHDGSVGDDSSDKNTGNCNGITVGLNKLNQFEAQLKQQNGEKARLEYALLNFEKYCFQTIQVAHLAQTFQSEYMRLEFVKFMYYYSSDSENFYLLNSLFKNERMKQSLEVHTKMGK